MFFFLPFLPCRRSSLRLRVTIDVTISPSYRLFTCCGRLSFLLPRFFVLLVVW